MHHADAPPVIGPADVCAHGCCVLTLEHASADDWGEHAKSIAKQHEAQVLLINDVPHSWLFSRCSAVVHHGGAGMLMISGLSVPSMVHMPHVWWLGGATCHAGRTSQRHVLAAQAYGAGQTSLGYMQAPLGLGWRPESPPRCCQPSPTRPSGPSSSSECFFAGTPSCQWHIKWLLGDGPPRNRPMITGPCLAAARGRGRGQWRLSA
jgi:hypothetical protein